MAKILRISPEQGFLRLPVLVAFVVFILVSCTEQPKQVTASVQKEPETEVALYRVEKSYRMMGTKFTLILYAKDVNAAGKHVKTAFDLAAKVNEVCSDYKHSSELNKLNLAKEGSPVLLSTMLWDVLQKADKFVKFSEGVFDPTAGVHSFQWRLSRLDSELPSTEKIIENKKAVGWDKLLFNNRGRSVVKKVPGMRLDLGGVAKGYAGDMMFNYLKSKGYDVLSVSCGGDLRIGSTPPGQNGWKVEILNVDANGEVSKKYRFLENCAISTSGDLHQYVELGGKRYSHIIDPKTGLGMTQRVTATVIAPEAVLTDMYATGACLDHEIASKLAKKNGVSVLRVVKEGEKLEAFKSGIFEANLEF